MVLASQLYFLFALEADWARADAAALRREYTTTHPETVARLLQHLLPQAPRPVYECQDVEQIVERLIQAPVPRHGLRQLCHELSRLGCLRASELNERVRG